MSEFDIFDFHGSLRLIFVLVILSAIPQHINLQLLAKSTIPHRDL